MIKDNCLRFSWAASTDPRPICCDADKIIDSDFIADSSRKNCEIYIEMKCYYFSYYIIIFFDERYLSERWKLTF